MVLEAQQQGILSGNTHTDVYRSPFLFEEKKRKREILDVWTMNISYIEPYTTLSLERERGGIPPYSPPVTGWFLSFGRGQSFFLLLILYISTLLFHTGGPLRTVHNMNIRSISKGTNHCILEGGQDTHSFSSHKGALLAGRPPLLDAHV